MKIAIPILFTFKFVFFGIQAEAPIPESPEITTELVSEENDLEPFGLWLTLLTIKISFTLSTSILGVIYAIHFIPHFILSNLFFLNYYFSCFILQALLSLSIGIFSYRLLHKLFMRKKPILLQTILIFILILTFEVINLFFNKNLLTNHYSLTIEVLIVLVYIPYLVISKKVKRIFIY